MANKLIHIFLELVRVQTIFWIKLYATGKNYGMVDCIIKYEVMCPVKHAHRCQSIICSKTQVSSFLQSILFGVYVTNPHPTLFMQGRNGCIV